MPFEDYFHAIVMMTSMCRGQVVVVVGKIQPLSWKLFLARPPWDWRVNHNLFLWLPFASKVQAALMNVACVNLKSLLGKHGKMEKCILGCHPSD